MSVSNVDFGRERRDAVRAFARLLDLCEEQEKDILRDPVKYFRMAQAENGRLQRLIDTAREALYDQSVMEVAEPAVYRGMDTMVVVKSQYQRLVECAKIVESGSRC